MARPKRFPDGSHLLSVKLSKGLYIKLQQHADYYGESVSTVVRNMLRKELWPRTKENND